MDRLDSNGDILLSSRSFSNDSILLFAYSNSRHGSSFSCCNLCMFLLDFASIGRHDEHIVWNGCVLEQLGEDMKLCEIISE